MAGAQGSAVGLELVAGKAGHTEEGGAMGELGGDLGGELREMGALSGSGGVKEYGMALGVWD